MVPKNRLTKYGKVRKTARCIPALVQFKPANSREDKKQSKVTFPTQSFPTPICGGKERPAISETWALCQPAKGSKDLPSTYSLLATVIMILASDNLWQKFPFSKSSVVTPLL